MSIQKRTSLFALITLLALLTSFLFPITVLADDEPPPPAPTEEIIVDEEPAPQTDLQLDTVSEVLEQLPENTEIVVLDESGEPIPLVTQEAEEAIIIGDPVWCPSTLSAPTPESNGCTSSYTSFQDLITYLDANEQAEAGVIWIESSYDSSVNDATSSGFSIQESFFTTMSNYALTIQGGWSGISGDASIGSASVFNGDFIFIDWNANVTVNNISINNTTSDGLIIDTTQDINISNVSANNNQANGITATTNNNNSNFTFSNITANDNGYNGASFSVGSLILNGTNSFNNNAWMGLDINAPEAIILNNVTANDNTSTGVSISNYGGTEDVIINSMITMNNGGHGIFIASNGDNTLTNIISTENLGSGLELYNNYGGIGEIIIENSNFSNNESGGTIHSNNNITLNSVVSNQNMYGGININSYGGGNIFVENSIFSNNSGGAGIQISSQGSITLSNITANGNSSGASIQGYGAPVFISSSTFNSNTYYGIDAEYTTASLFLNNVSFDCLNGWGDFIYNSTVYTVCEEIPSPEEEPNSPEPVSYSLNTLLVNEGENIELDCENYSGTKLILENGNLSTFNCPITGSVSLNTLESENLPSTLPEGMEYVSGLVATQSPQGSDVALDSLVIISFVIPNDLIGEELAILYWNDTEWIDLATATFDDGRSVFNGGYVSPNGYFEAFTNFVGNFVLVKK